MIIKLEYQLRCFRYTAVGRSFFTPPVPAVEPGGDGRGQRYVDH